MFKNSRVFLLPLLFVIGSILYWMLPIGGQIAFVPSGRNSAETYPAITIDRQPEQTTVLVRDLTAYTNVHLESPDATATIIEHGEQDENGVWQWRWAVEPEAPLDTINLYHSCPTGCQAWATVHTTQQALPTAEAGSPTKLGIVFANRDRDWHGQQGWDVEITYAQLADEEFWGVDDLAKRVAVAHSKNLRVLVRVEYGQGQSIPPADDAVALDEYLRFVQRLTRDARLANVYGFIIGSNFNTAGGNSQAPDQLVTPAWYARVFNGYGVDPTLGNNAIEVARRENGNARILVGPVNPWNTDQDGPLPFEIDTPWLNYMHSVTQFVDAGAAAKLAIGVAGTAPDGFAVQAFGRVGDLEQGALEPFERISAENHPNAHMGFRIFEDWLAIVNQFEHTRGKPLYINASNTFDPLSGSVPAENYPAGWLTNAMEVINAEPQIAALCWFIDGFVHDEQWAMFSLIEPRGNLAVAASEFDTLLRGNSAE